MTAVLERQEQPTLDPAFVATLTSEVRSTTGRTFDAQSPITGGAIGQIPLSSAQDVADAYTAARSAQRAWAALPVAERAAIILRFHDLVLQHRDEGLDIVQWETGKARRDALEELLDVCINARYYARDAARLLKPRRVRGGLPLLIGAKEFRVPKGVVGIIAPWNYPLTLAVSDAIPALLAGNTVVVKPDSQTALTALWALHILHNAGLPRGVLNVVAGPGAELGEPLVAGADYMMFTGSTQVGRTIAKLSGERLIGCSLELGGKNAMIVCSDVALERATETAVRGCFSNSGQLCESMERMYIHQDVWDRFVPRFLERVAGLRHEVGVGWGADVGSLISQKQLDTVSAHVADAVAKGATVLAGGRARPDLGPFAYEPTVLTDVTEEMIACREETFGPVVSLYRVADEDEAIARSNDTRYGLNASVLCKDTKRGVEIARRLRAGTVNVNEGYAAAWATIRAPLGGMGDSGLGRRHGDEGFTKYTESQTVAVQRVMGFGVPKGLNDEQWGAGLTLAVKAMKTAGIK